MFRNQMFRLRITIFVLTTFTMASVGLPSWAESCAARRDPVGTLVRLADNPHLTLMPEQRARLREIAFSLRDRNHAVELLDGLSDNAGLSLRPEQRRALEAILDCAPQTMLPPQTRRQATPRHATRASVETMHRLSRRLADAAAADKATDKGSLGALRDELTAAHRQILADFAAVEAGLPKDLPADRLARHQALRAGYEREIKVVFADLDAATTDPALAKYSLEDAAARLAGTTAERPRPELDLSQLPFRRVETVERTPAFGAQKSAPAQAVTSKTAPTAEDLAATVDAQITPEIEALAASLGNQPLSIYDWVRNSIDFVPTFGSVQGSQVTLDARRGNAFDIASLLIALLRAADVPARYALGTVQVPVADVTSWVGVADGRVAQQVLGQGGIPNVGLLDGGGTLSHIRLDHVWVEAWIDNVPSRGAVQRTGDTWLPLDAAFKRSVATPESGVFEALPLETVFADELDGTPTLFNVDATTGKISDFDSVGLGDLLGTWADASDSYLLANPVATEFDAFLGGRDLVEVASTVFAGALPYQVLSREPAIAELPSSLRHSVEIRGYRSTFDRAADHRAIETGVSLPELGARRLGISFPPATTADADYLEALRTSGATSIPVYLVDVAPQVTLDGAELARADAVTMGQNYFFDVVLRGPDGPTVVPYQIIAGDEIVVGVTGNGVSPTVAQKRFDTVPVDDAPEYFHQVQLSYWLQSDYLGEIAARRLGVRALRLPSVGFFSSPLTVSYLFGAPRSGVYASRTMDVKRSLIGAAGPNPELVAAFVKQAGYQGSYLEGSVFDQLENQLDAPRIRGISAVHLLGLAAAQGIPIYHITQENAAAALPQLQLSSAVEQDISNALARGETVLAPETELDLGSWQGVGYILQDEETGAGAYLISGGLAGGGILDCIEELVPDWVKVLFWVLVFILAAYLLWLALGALAGLLGGLVLGGGLAGAGAAAAAFLFLILLGLGAGPTSGQTA